MHRVNNYGSFWQAYCLKELLENNNNSVEFIDIIPGKSDTISEYKKSFAFEKLKRIPYYLFQRKKNSMFYDVQKNYLGCPDERNYNVDYDAIFIGSDEVFNFVQKSPWGFTTQLYGDMNNKNIYTYAACFGATSYSDIVERGYEKELIHSLNNIKNISVRDDNSFQIIRTLLGTDSQIHLDPVLIGNLPIDNLPKIKEKDPYILVYSYDFRFSDQAIISKIREFAKKEKCKIYSVGFYQDWCDKNIVVSVHELLSFFKEAKYIVTDTFHGSIFSIRLHKKFITVIRDSNKHKLEDLLSRVRMKHRLIDENSDLEAVIKQEIDYKTFENDRAIELNRTKNYIQECMYSVK